MKPFLRGLAMGTVIYAGLLLLTVLLMMLSGCAAGRKPIHATDWRPYRGEFTFFPDNPDWTRLDTGLSEPGLSEPAAMPRETE